MSEAISLGSPVTIVQEWAEKHSGRCVTDANRVDLYFTANKRSYSVAVVLVHEYCLFVQFALDLELASADEETEGAAGVEFEAGVHERSDEVADIVDYSNDYNAFRDFPGAFMYVEANINALFWRAPIVLVMPGMLTYGQLDFVLCQGVLAIEEFLVFIGRTQATAESLAIARPHGNS
jgi:hypothetical protein